MQKGQPNYYAIIPANVRYDGKLKANEKLLYAEITSLTHKDGICWASNTYFAELYNVSRETVSRWVSNLSKYGYVQVRVIRNKVTNEVEKRVISIPVTPIDENVNTSPQNNQDPIDEKINTPIDENVKENNTRDEYYKVNNPTISPNEKLMDFPCVLDAWVKNGKPKPSLTDRGTSKDVYFTEELTDGSKCFNHVKDIIEAIELFSKHDKDWREGFRPKLSKFLKEEQWRTPPRPKVIDNKPSERSAELERSAQARMRTKQITCDFILVKKMPRDEFFKRAVSILPEHVASTIHSGDVDGAAYACLMCNLEDKLLKVLGGKK